MYLNCDITLANIQARNKVIEENFRVGSKGYDAARHIIRQNRMISKDEMKAICQGIPIGKSTLEGIFTKLRRLGLYPPPEPPDTPDLTSTPEKPQVTSQPVPKVPQPPLQEYVTKEDFDTKFETVINSINNLASLMNRDPPLNPGEYEEEYEDEADEMPLPGEPIQPGEMMVQGGSSNREAVFIKPKTRMYYDMSKQGAFHNYPGTREPGPFANFNGSLSDFFNIIVDEFFVRNYNADIGLTMVMPVK